jgi:hypothetical protein
MTLSSALPELGLFSSLHIAASRPKNARTTGKFVPVRSRLDQSLRHAGLSLMLVARAARRQGTASLPAEFLHRLQRETVY